MCVCCFALAFQIQCQYSNFMIKNFLIDNKRITLVKWLTYFKTQKYTKPRQRLKIYAAERQLRVLYQKRGVNPDETRTKPG